MAVTWTNHDHASALSESVWDIALRSPAQGAWSVAEYLALDAGRLVEFDDGYIEVLPVPSQAHQLIALRLFEAFPARASLGALVMIAPHPVKLWAGTSRQPDARVLLPEHIGRSHKAYCEQPDLVVAIVSPDQRKRTWKVKRSEYAQAMLSGKLQPSEIRLLLEEL